MNKSANAKREHFLKKYYSKKILNLFSEDITKITDGLYEEPISHDEAVAVLEYTISEIGKMPLLF